MAEKVIAYRVKIVNESGQIVEQTATTFKELKKSVADLENELQNTDFGSEQFKELNKELKNSKGALEEAQNSNKSFTESLTSLPGPIGGVINGAKSLNATFMKLVLNPIGAVIAAIVVGLTALYKAFTSTKAGGEAVEQVMAGLGAVMDVLRDRVLKVGSALVKFFTGDFAGAAEDVKGAFSGIGEEIAGEFQQAMELKKELQAIDDATRELNNTRAEQNKLIAEAKLKINDENLSYEERQKALDEVRTAEIALAKQEEELAKRRFEAIKAQNALSDSSKEALDEEARAYQALQNAQQQSLLKQKELFDQQKALRDKEKAERKAAADEAKRQRDEVLKLEQDLTIAVITDETERAKLQAEIQFNAQIAEINALKTTEAKKKELRLLAEQEYQIGVDKIDADAEAKRKEREQKDIDDANAKAQTEYDLELRRIQALLQLEEMKYEEGFVMQEEDFQRTLDLQKELTEKLLENDKLTAEERQVIQEQYNQFVLKSTRKRLSDEEQLERAKLQATADLLGGISQLAGEQSVFGKAAAIAQATINTYLGATEAYTATVGLLGPVGASIAAGLAIASGLKSVNAIMNTETPEPPSFSMGGIVGGYGYGTEDNITARVSSGEAVMSKGAVDLFSPILSMMNTLGGGRSFSGGLVSTGADAAQIELINSVKKGNQTPVKAFVVSTQMENQMMLDRATKSRSLI
jgi:hypothetical protein